MSALTLLGALAPPAIELATRLVIQSRSPRSLDQIGPALRRLEASPLASAVRAYQRNLADLPGLGQKLEHLDRVRQLPDQRRGCLGELTTALRLEKLGVRVLDVSRDVVLDGRRFTDLDVITRRGSVVEVRDWTSPMSASAIADKVERLAYLRDRGCSVDGVPVERLYLYAPGGVSHGARQLLEARHIEVLVSASDLARVR